jgi:hypothetical protein
VFYRFFIASIEIFPVTLVVRMVQAGTSVSSKVATVAITAVLYAVAKALTSFIPTPWGVGQLLIGIFVPAFMAVLADTLSVAVGAALGTFLGDTLFLTPAGTTNPALSLIAGVPANFVAFLLFGWFVKKYRSWPAFVAATVSFVTLGNVVAASSIVLFGTAVFTPISGLVTHFNLVALILGFTVFWTSTMVPSVLIAVPLLIRAVKPLNGRSPILSNYPSWSGSVPKNRLITSIVFAVVFVALGGLFLLMAPSNLFAVPNTPFYGITSFILIAAASLIIVGPLVGVIAGARLTK